MVPRRVCRPLQGRGGAAAALRLPAVRGGGRRRAAKGTSSARERHRRGQVEPFARSSPHEPPCRVRRPSGEGDPHAVRSRGARPARAHLLAGGGRVVLGTRQGRVPGRRHALRPLRRRRDSVGASQHGAVGAIPCLLARRRRRHAAVGAGTCCGQAAGGSSTCGAGGGGSPLFSRAGIAPPRRDCGGDRVRRLRWRVRATAGNDGTRGRVVLRGVWRRRQGWGGAPQEAEVE
mmetsp:Transcript_4965/g.16134  ORF Transcript_4965/g.16134 Transcript_4965/m.16134 type:complete len:232 (+) Transcript_4965:1236-1931(+)